MFKSKVNFYNYNPEKIAGYLMQKDWKGCWDYVGQLIESFSFKVDKAHILSIQEGFSDQDKKKYAQEFGGLMGELILALLTHPESRIDDENFRNLIYTHEEIHTLFDLAGLHDTDAIVGEILKQKKLSPFDQKRLLLLLSMRSNKDIPTILKKVSSEYRALAIANYLGYLKIYDETVYNNKVLLNSMGKELEKIDATDSRSLMSILSPYFFSTYIMIDDRHSIRLNINNAFKKFFHKNKKEIDILRATPRNIGDFVCDDSKPIILVNWEYFNDDHAVLRVWGAWVKALEKDFNVINIAPKRYEGACTRFGFQNIAHYNATADFLKLAYRIKADIMIYTTVGMTFLGTAPTNLRLAPIQIQCMGQPATANSDVIDFVYGPPVAMKPEAFPNDKILLDNLPLLYEERISREDIKNFEIQSYKKGSGRPIKAFVVGTEIKLSAPFIKLLKELEEESDFDIEFSFFIATAGMDTLFAEKFFLNKFKNVQYCGMQPYEDFLNSLKEADIVLNPFPFGHTNTLIDTLLMGKPCIGLEGIEVSSLTEKMLLREVGLEDQFSATSLDDYKAKFKTICRRIMDGDTHFYDRMEMFDKLYEPVTPPDYSKSIMWVYKNAQKMKEADKKMFTIGEDDF
jgi:hypothetical protein